MQTRETKNSAALSISLNSENEIVVPDKGLWSKLSDNWANSGEQNLPQRHEQE